MARIYERGGKVYETGILGDREIGPVRPHVVLDGSESGSYVRNILDPAIEIAERTPFSRESPGSVGGQKGTWKKDPGFTSDQRRYFQPDLEEIVSNDPDSSEIPESGGSGGGGYNGGVSDSGWWYEGWDRPPKGPGLLEMTVDGLGKLIDIAAKTAGYIAAGLSIGAYVGAYAIYSHHVDKKKNQPKGTHFKESVMMKNVKDYTISHLREKGFEPSPSYRTKSQIKAEEEQAKKKVEEEKKIKEEIAVLRNGMKNTVTQYFFDDGPKDSDDLLGRLKQIGKRLAEIDPTYNCLEPNNLIHEAYTKKFSVVR